MRVLALASKEIKIENKLIRESVEGELDLIGLLGISDPPREEVSESLKIARTAGIEVVMVTGDSSVTAQAIGHEIGLLKEGDLVMEGGQLNSLDDEAFGKIIEKVRIFARATPEQKLKIVKAYQEKGKTVAVTGDGVNDAPALRSAEVGVAMGVVGTEVAKEASDMVITDDNFSSIVKAVEEGRVIYDNIVKSLRYLLSDNASEFFTIFGAALLGLPTPLAATQILWINLVSDGLPALAISADPKDPDVMKRMPRNKRVSLLNFVSIPYLITIGLLFSSIVIIIFSLSLLRLPELQAKTLAFNLMVLVHIFAAYFARKTKKLWDNKFLLGAILLTLALQIIINLIPALHQIFRITSLF
ncbi:MAG: hypothetical protein A2Y57_04390 [Candidatus Woykebacteria bacterium RBG_13_40_7b]|uniref:Cation-transporting P-type ATPase C-terminal domain-containing protein n=1 Tax=Candidatus Woykebacteria bacterium RBG_13_40_7b TaxID=1802594 RepID=A0A1G1W7U9_9BACT|nr:MAG: hypothetical protein A2Y57_04390 [Candidatus Woykebacteria bacterium RBG_13_40_7b]